MIYVNGRFLSQKLTGVQRFAFEIVRAWKKAGAPVKVLAPTNIVQKHETEELDAELCPGGVGHLWEQFTLISRLKEEGNPLLINLANTAPLLYSNKISTIHDVAYARFPDSFSRKFRWSYRAAMPIIARTSRKVITVSEFSKRELQAELQVPGEKIAVVNCAASEIFKEDPSVSRGDYVLAVSSITQQKNFKTLLDAFALPPLRNATLYVVGEKSSIFSGQDFKEAANVVWLGRVSDTQLADMYRRARLFALPSLYEGFGIPPLEAQSCGCPVAISNSSCLPEIYGDSAIYFDPKSSENIASVLAGALADAQLLESYSKRGLINKDRFSWETSGEKYWGLIREFINGRDQ